MFHEVTQFDACVIGSGASGSVVANALVAAGLRVAIIERGDFMPAGAKEEEHGHQNSDLAYVATDAGMLPIGRPWTTCNVGGGTVFYGGVAFRPRLRDFEPTRHFPESDLPVRWPFRFDELEPYLVAIERRQGVSALGHDDPLFPGNRFEHFLAPVATTKGGVRLRQGADALGVRAFATPLAILSRPVGDRPACGSLRLCDGHRCPSRSKGDAYTVFLEPILGDQRCRLFTASMATRLIRDRRDRVSAVEYVEFPKGDRRRIRADAFFVAGNAIQSSALLLRSCDQWSPAGLGNEHDMVGRGLCMKVSQLHVGLLTAKSGDNIQTGPFSTFATSDYYLDNRCPTGLGGMIYEVRPNNLATSESVLVEALLADTPRRRNRIRLLGVTDALGIPRIVIDYKSSLADLSRLLWLGRRAHEILKATGTHRQRTIDTGYENGSAHLHGGCRAGEDERTSVVDSDGRIHGIKNTYVVDGGFFPSPTGVNPTLTIQANAHRIVSRFLGAPSAVDFR